MQQNHNLHKLLPHRKLGLIPVHIVMRLKNSLPVAEIRRIKTLQQAFVQQETNQPSLNSEDSSQLVHINERISEHFEQLFEQAIHEKSNGPYFLRSNPAKAIIINCWKWIAEKQGLLLYAVCVMDNHIHVLIQVDGVEEKPLGPIIKSFKSFTARKINKIIDNTGQSLWEKNYFDRDVRKGQFTRVMWYILNNPVKAGLVDNWQDWKGSYVHPDWEGLFIG